VLFSLQQTARKVFTDTPIHRAPDCAVGDGGRISLSWRCLRQLPYPTQINSMLCAASISFGNGIHWMISVSASSAARSLQAVRFKLRAAHVEMDLYGSVAQQSGVTPSPWIGCCLRTKFWPGPNHRRPKTAAVCLQDQLMAAQNTAWRRDCARSRCTSSELNA
jgi:hypothetical protein